MENNPNLELEVLSPDSKSVDKAAMEIRKTAVDKRKAKLLADAQLVYQRYRLFYQNGQWDYLKMNRAVIYFLAQQDPQQYLTKWERTVTNKAKDPFDTDSLEVDNIKVLNHVIVTMLGNMAEQDFDVDIYRLDDKANNMRNQLRENLEIAMITKKFGILYQTLLDQNGITEDELPIDDFELEKYLIDRPMAEEANMQRYVKDYLLRINFKESMLPMLRLNMLLFGYGNMWFDSMAKTNQVRVSNPYFRISSYNRQQDGSDSTMEAEILMVPLPQLKIEAQDQIEDWNSVEGVATSYIDFFNKYNNLVLAKGTSNGVFRAGMYPLLEAERVVAVLHLVEKKTDMITFERRVCKDGRIRTFIGKNKTGSSVIKEIAITRWETTKWIIGTKEMYQWDSDGSRLSMGGPIDEADPNADHENAESGVIGMRPAAFDGKNVAPVDKAIDFINEIQQLWVKAHRMTKRILMPIVKVDKQGFAGMVIGAGSNVVTGFDVAKNFIVDGMAVYDSKNYAGMHNTNKDAPITVENTEELRKIRETFDQIALLINMLREFMAVPPQMNGVLPGTRTGKGVSDLVIDQARVSMKPFYDGIQNIYERLVRVIVIHGKYNGKKGSYKGKNYEINPAETWEHIYGIHVRAMATKERWERLYQFIDRALDGGWLKMSTALDVENAEDVKDATLMFKIAESRATAQAQKEADYNMEKNMEQAQASIEATTQSKIAVDQSKETIKGQAALAVQTKKNEAVAMGKEMDLENQITIMRLEDDQMDTIAKKVVSLLQPKQETAKNKK